MTPSPLVALNGVLWVRIIYIFSLDSAVTNFLTLDILAISHGFYIEWDWEQTSHIKIGNYSAW